MKTCVFDPKESFAVYPVTIGYNYVQERVYRPSGMKIHQIFIISDGSGVINVGNKEYNLEKGDMFFVGKNLTHSYGGSDDFKTIFLGFEGIICEKLFAYYKVSDFSIYRGKNYAGIVAEIGELYNNFEKFESQASLSSAAYSILISFFDTVTKEESTPIEAVRNFIEVNFFKQLSLNDILDFYPFSKAKLCREFKENYGMTVFDMITKIRLMHAKNMISNDPEIKLKLVAKCCGFNDMSYFCKMYKKIYGTSPKGD